MLSDVEKNFSDVTNRVQGRAQKVLADFRSFVFKQNVFALAIAVIIGTATNNLVQAMIKDMVMPVVNLVIKDQSWKDYGPTISEYYVPRVGADGQVVRDAGGKVVVDPVDNRLLLGDLLWQATNLLVIGVIAYAMARYLLRPKADPPPGPPTRPCPFCLEAVVTEARVCKYCTRDLPAFEPPGPEATPKAP
jgi:large-conductance mechanosensitive channel